MRLNKKDQAKVLRSSWEDPETFMVDLVAGWRNYDEYTHSIFENTEQEAATKVKWAVPCNCEECQTIIAKGEKE